MKLISDVETISISGGDGWDDFLAGLGWTLGIACGVTANPAVCGAAVVVAAVNLFY